MDIATPVDKSGKVIRTRPVRLILLERLEGTEMSKIKPSSISRKARDNILVKAIHADTTIHNAGSEQNDFSPRNIMVIGTNLKDPALKVIICDFNIALCDV